MPPREITILLVGDEFVGKSSIVSSYVSQIFSDHVPSIMQTVRIPPDQSEENVAVSVIDSQGSGFLSIPSHNIMSSSNNPPAEDSMDPNDSMNMSFMSNASDISHLLEDNPPLSSNAPNAHAGDHSSTHAIAPYSSTSSSTSASSSSSNGKRLSIIAVASLEHPETFDRLTSYWLPLISNSCPNTPVLIAGNKSDLREDFTEEEQKSIIKPILEQYKFVYGYMECSAKSLQSINELFFMAQSNVLYPIQPVFDLFEGTLSPKMDRILNRIFRLLDVDQDGFLSDDELYQFEINCFNVKLHSDDIRGFKTFIKKSDKAKEGLSSDGKISLIGWKVLIELLITKNNMKVPWTILRYFGYDDSLNLEVDNADIEKVTARKRAGLTPAAVKFLASNFNSLLPREKNISTSSSTFAKLSLDGLSPFFDVLEGNTLPPWHPSRREEFFSHTFSKPLLELSVIHKMRAAETVEMQRQEQQITQGESLIIPEGDETEGGESDNSITLPSLSLESWMARWHLCSVLSPHKTAVMLYQLGFDIFSTNEGDGIGGRGREQGGGDEKNDNKLCVHCYVAGTNPLHKQKFISRAVGDDGGSSDNSDDIHDDEIDKGENLSSVAGPIYKTKDKKNPLYCVFTNVSTTTTQIDANEFDLIILMFDKSDVQSLRYAIEMECSLPDSTRRIFLGINGSSDDMKSYDNHDGDKMDEKSNDKNDENEDDNRDGNDLEVANIAREHCLLFDLEPPFGNDLALETIAVKFAQDDKLKTRPLMEQKRRKKRNEKIAMGIAGALLFGGGLGFLLWKKQRQTSIITLLKRRITLK